MHYRVLVTFEKEAAKTSQEAREYAFWTLMEDTSFIGGGRFGSAWCDWFVIGGRWSGELSRATWAKAVPSETGSPVTKYRKVPALMNAVLDVPPEGNAALT